MLAEIRGVERFSLDSLDEMVAHETCSEAILTTGDCATIDGGEWRANGGEFSHLTRFPRDAVKPVLRGMRER